MSVSPVEIGRLAILQKEPLRYVERRVEHLDMVDDYHYGVTVTQQVLIPHHGTKASKEDGLGTEDKPELELLVPLGQFSKDRMPDLRVVAADGVQLPLLSRNERVQIGASLFGSQWRWMFLHGVDNSDVKSAKAAWSVINELIARIVDGSSLEAEVMVEALRRTLTAWTRPGRHPDSIRRSTERMLAAKKMWDELEHLAKTRLLVARMRGTPGRSYAIALHYTERFDYRPYPRTRSVWRSLQGLLAGLGLLGKPIERTVANMGKTASLWVVQSVPEGAEILRYYWSRDRRHDVAPDPVSVKVNRAAASDHPSSDSNRQNRLRLEVQLAQSPALTALIGMSILLLLVSTYVYQALPGVPGSGRGHAIMVSSAPNLLGARPDDGDRLLLVGLGSIFAAIPAAIVGALAYRGQTFTRRISRGPRALTGLLCAMAAIFAVVVSLKNFKDLSETTAYIVSVYCLWLIGIAGYIQWGPRWRKTERSRWKRTTVETSPLSCRRRQFWAALGFLVAWTAVTIVFARCQAVLQEKHFFTSEFPLNLWHAWRSWF